MDLRVTDPWSWLIWVGGILLTLLTWQAKRALNKQQEHDLRLRTLESTMATKGDITAVYEKVGELSNQSSSQYSALMNTLLGRSHR